MTPIEKAIELVDKFYQRFPLKMDVITIRGGLSWEYDSWNEAKQCALIAVDEILNARPLEPNYVDWDDCGATHQYWYEAQKEEALEFWNNVKSELQSL